jgi:Spy/CpxP family protein refolding chaperone
MKVSRFKIVTAALAVALMGAVAVSQTVGKAPYGDFGAHMLGFMTDYLDLTDAQQAQVKDILAKEKPNIQPLLDQLKQSHQEMMALETGGTFDANTEAKVRAVAAQQAQTMTELMVQKARIHSELFQLLTPDQKAKAIKLMNRHAQHMQGTPGPGI